MVNDGFETLRALRAPEHLPPSTVSIGRALAAGRRRERNRRLVAVAAVAVAVGATIVGASAFAALDHRAAPMPADQDPSPPAPAPPSLNGCTVQRLPTPGNRPAGVSAVDPNGTTVAGRLDESAPGRGDDTLLLWIDGQLRTLDDAPQPHPTAAALLGQNMVGNSGDAQHSVPWLFTDGRFTKLALPPIPDSSVTVTGINARGEIVGNATSPKSGPVQQSQVVLWTVAHPETFSAKPAGTPPFLARGITDDGAYYGTTVDAGGTRAAVWEHTGAATPLTRAGGRPAGSVEDRAGDFLIGTYEDGTTWYDQGVRWNRRDGSAVDLGPFVPGGVDTTGRLFGSDMRSETEQPPAMWRDGKILELPVLVKGQSASISGASRDGRLVGGYLELRKNDPITPARWTCPG